MTSTTTFPMMMPPSSASSGNPNAPMTVLPPMQSPTASTTTTAASPVQPTSSSQSPLPRSRWFFNSVQLEDTPSARAGLHREKELSYRQQAANFIQDMGQRLQVTQLCINTAIVYMQRFYMFHSFHRFHRNSIASASLFLAAKVEEQPRKLEHVIKVAHICLHREQPPPDARSDAYMEQAQELVRNENILLQTLGFDVAIDHPHTHVVKCCQLVKASKELAQTSYFMATNSLHLTTMCLRYPPTIVACVCIHLACRWAKYGIPMSADNKPWYSYVDPAASISLLERLTEEFIKIFDNCPSRLRKKIMASTEATKKEEERRNLAGANPSVYNPDLSVRRQEPSSSSSSTLLPFATSQHSSGGGGSSSSSNPGPGQQQQRSSSHHSASGRQDKHPPRPDHKRDQRAQQQPPHQHAMQRSQQSLLDPSKIAALGQKVPPQQQRSLQQHQQQQQQQRHHHQQQQHRDRRSLQPGQAQPGQPQQPPSRTSLPPQHQIPPLLPGLVGQQQQQPQPQSKHHHSSSSHHRHGGPVIGAPPPQQQQHGHKRPHPQQQQQPHSAAKRPHLQQHSSHYQQQQQQQHHLQQQQQQRSGGGHHSSQPQLPTMPSAHAQPLPPIQPMVHHQRSQQQQPPPLPPLSQSSSSSSSAAPSRSIFDIEKSPFSGAGIEKLLAPIMSPANLSDVSDLADNGALMAESAAEVPLEPGEILDTPGVANSIFNFPPSAKSSSSNPRQSGSSSMIGSLLGGPPDHHLPGHGNVKKEVKRESGSWAAAAGGSSRSHHPAKSSSSSSSKHGAVKLEPSSNAFGLPSNASKKTTPSPTKQSKQRSLFSPPAESAAAVAAPPFKTEPRTRTTSSSSSASATSPSVKLSKLEQMPGYEKLKDGRTSVRLPKEERTTVGNAATPTSMKVSIPMAGTAASGSRKDALFDDSAAAPLVKTEHAQSEHRSEKKKKKKDKKEKKEKRDKDKKDEKRHKHKHKDRDRDKEGGSSSRHSTASNSPAAASAAAATATPSSGLKLKVKLPTTPGGGGEGQVAPIRLSLGAGGEGGGSSGSKKRKGSESSGNGNGGGPASKMSRVLGTPLELENGYVREKGIGGGKK